jgi:hypothetical protein
MERVYKKEVKEVINMIEIDKKMKNVIENRLE